MYQNIWSFKKPWMNVLFLSLIQETRSSSSLLANECGKITWYKWNKILLANKLGTSCPESWFEHNFEKAVNRRQCPNLQGHCLHNLYLLFPQSAMQFHWKVKLQWWIFQSKGAVIRLHMSCDVPNSYLHILHASCDVPNSYIHILTDKVSACDELFKCIKMSFM